LLNADGYELFDPLEEVERLRAELRFLSNHKNKHPDWSEE
jgi:hypothetical protein